MTTARFSHSRLRFEQLPMFPSAPDLAFIAGQNEMGLITVSGLTPLGGTNLHPSTNNSFYWTLSNDLSYSVRRHLLKSGVLIEHLRTNKLTATNIRGSYTFANVRTFLAGTPSRFVGVPPGAQLERVRPNTLFGFYLQDDAGEVLPAEPRGHQHRRRRHARPHGSRLRHPAPDQRQADVMPSHTYEHSTENGSVRPGSRLEQFVTLVHGFADVVVPLSNVTRSFDREGRCVDCK